MYALDILGIILVIELRKTPLIAGNPVKDNQQLCVIQVQRLSKVYLNLSIKRINE